MKNFFKFTELFSLSRVYKNKICYYTSFDYEPSSDYILLN